MTYAIKQSSVYAALILLIVMGAVLLLGAGFCFLLAFLEPQGRHGAGGLVPMSLMGLFLASVGAGFLWSKPLPKLISSILLAGGGVWMCFHDAFRRENWWIYFLFFAPLLLAMFLSRAGADFVSGRLSDAY